jgi:hypothetical protein
MVGFLFLPVLHHLYFEEPFTDTRNPSFLGPLARIGPNLLVTDDVELLRHMSAARSPYSRSDWYDGMRLDPKVNNVISERNDKRHNALRAKLASGVSLHFLGYLVFD